MQRGSDRHNPRTDDDLKEEFGGTERANRPTRANEWRDPEVPTDMEPGREPFEAGGEDADADNDGEGDGTDESR